MNRYYMRKLLFLLPLLGVLGCTVHLPPPQPQYPPTQQLPAIPPIIQIQPRLAPSVDYLAGYSDAFYGHYLAPMRYAFSADYRDGYGTGKFDREHGLPFRYPRVM